MEGEQGDEMGAGGGNKMAARGVEWQGGGWNGSRGDGWGWEVGEIEWEPRERMGSWGMLSCFVQNRPLEQGSSAL